MLPSPARLQLSPPAGNSHTAPANAQAPGAFSAPPVPHSLMRIVPTARQGAQRTESARATMQQYRSFSRPLAELRGRPTLLDWSHLAYVADRTRHWVLSDVVTKLREFSVPVSRLSNLAVRGYLKQMRAPHEFIPIRPPQFPSNYSFEHMPRTRASRPQLVRMRTIIEADPNISRDDFCSRALRLGLRYEQAVHYFLNDHRIEDPASGQRVALITHYTPPLDETREETAAFNLSLVDTSPISSASSASSASVLSNPATSLSSSSINGRPASPLVIDLSSPDSNESNAAALQSRIDAREAPANEAPIWRPWI